MTPTLFKEEKTRELADRQALPILPQETSGWQDADIVSPYPDRNLYWYQTQAAKEALNHLFYNDGKSFRIVLPTGCGKTMVFTTIMHMLAGSKNILVLSNRRSIFRQIKLNLLDAGIVPILECGEKKGLYQFEGRGQIVLATPQTMHPDRCRKWDRKSFDLIINDEAHHIKPHCRDNHWFKVLRWFHTAKRLGVTATPGYTKIEKGIISYHYINGWEKTAEPLTLFQAIQQGFLANIHFKSVPTPIDLRKIGKTYGEESDFNQNDLEDEIYRNTNRIATAIKDLTKPHYRGIVFTTRIRSAEAIAAALNDIGITAKAIHSDTPNREQIELDHKNGDYQYIISVDAHTEGWDAPYLNVAFNLRPTMSVNAMRQRVGRVTRICRETGKTEATFYDFTDATTTLPLVGADEYVREELQRQMPHETPEDIFEALAEMKRKGHEVEELGDALEEAKKTLEEIKAEREERERQRLLREQEERDRLEAYRIKNREERMRLVVQKISPRVGRAVGITPSMYMDDSPRAEPATEAQVKAIAKMSKNIIPTEGLSKRAAAKIIGDLVTDAKKGMSSPAQRQVIVERLGVYSLDPYFAQRMTRKEASEYIERHKTW